MESKSFLVTIKFPEWVSDGIAEDYIEEAIRAWIGSKDPDNPMHEMDRKNIEVRRWKT